MESNNSSLRLDFKRTCYCVEMYYKQLFSTDIFGWVEITILIVLITKKFI